VEKEEERVAKSKERRVEKRRQGHGGRRMVEREEERGAKSKERREGKREKAERERRKRADVLEGLYVKI
jgi:hypothetical protein